jgi:hypothetical protein
MAEEKAENYETYMLENEGLYPLCAYSTEVEVFYTVRAARCTADCAVNCAKLVSRTT